MNSGCVMNNKGFTLIELLTILVLLSIISLITVPMVANYLDISKDKSYDILIENIKVAAKSYYEECSYNKEALDNSYCNFDNNNSLEVSLNDLVNLGYLSGSNECDGNGNCSKKIKSPKGDHPDIGNCKITITKNKDDNDKITYTYVVLPNDSNVNCPKTSEFEVTD